MSRSTEHPRAGARWHTRTAEEVCRTLGVDPGRGLSPAEVHARRAVHGLNELEERAGRGWWRIYLDQFRSLLVAILLGAALVSGLVGDAADAAAIVVIVFLNAAIGFVQEYRAERAVAALKALGAPAARVRRGGGQASVAASELVPGDVVLLEAGAVVPADLRLVEVAELRAAEAALTGESQPVDKLCEPLVGDDLALGDRTNLAYKGTLVIHGRGTGVVVATGMASELGRVAALLGAEEGVRTPLQRRLERFSRHLALAALAISALVFGLGLLRGEPLVLMFLTAVSLAVAAIPEALPAVVTIALALGARRMVRERALVRSLPAVETLGSITTICVDKTGTLTQNTMRAEVFCAAGERRTELSQAGAAWAELAQALALVNDAAADEDGCIVGDPTEVALLEAALAAGADAGTRAPRLAELPFDATRKRMTTLHPRPDGAAGCVAYTKGAPESVLPRCVRVATADGAVALDRARALVDAENLAAEGYRVLAFAKRVWAAPPQPLDPETVETELVFLGLVALVDPPRPEAARSVALCKQAGIRPVMITGDHPATARSIAARLGFLHDGDRVVTGAELAGRDEGAGGLEHVRVFARVSPEQKIAIVRALQASGELVAMTGDGVNDAPALRRAEIGVAMGLGGTDVAREASAMILLDDDFSTIVRAVREGRRIYDNVRKFIKYTMTSNAGEIWTLTLAPFLGLPLPLLPIQILWINLVTDGLPGLALAVEPHERGIMQRPPRPPNESVFGRGAWQHMLWCGLLIAALSLGAQAWAWHAGAESWRTMVFTVLTLSQLVHALAIRSERDSLFVIGLGSNRPLLGAVLLTLGLQLAVVYVPWLQRTFHTKALDATELGVCLLLPWGVLLAVELEKLWVRRGRLFEPRTGGRA
jgi:P-type Ca2+ transporter type 2C